MQTLSPKQHEMLGKIHQEGGWYPAVINQTSKALLRKGLIRQFDDRFDITEEGTGLLMELTENTTWIASVWEQGYAAGWKDNELDLPKHHTENPYEGASND